LPNYHPKTILAAGNNKVNQKVIMAMLVEFRCNTDLTKNGQDVLERLGRHSFELVLMDSLVPVMDRYEASRILFSQKLSEKRTRIPFCRGRQKLPLIMLSA
jgi:two-component system sensor histidine kinase BarA